jgi:hypothetical protein
VPFRAFLARTSSTRGAEAHPGDLPLKAEPSRQGRLYRAPVKVTRYAQPRTPSTDSIPTLRPEVVERLNDVRQPSARPGHPVSRAVAARPVTGLPSRRVALLLGPLARPSHLRGPILRALRREDASCQSVQPTSCHEHPLDPSIPEPRACALTTERSRRRPVGARTGVRGTRQSRRRRRRTAA